jgi:hypothetical protein
MTVADVARVLRGLGRLLRLDPMGFKAFENTADEARRSFRAALYMAPLFVIFLAVDHATDEGRAPLSAFLILKTAHYVIGWTLFPVVMDVVSRLLARRQVYFRWLAAYNWMQVPVLMASLPVALLSQVADLGVIEMALFLAMATYLGFLARHGLGLTLSTAVAVVVLDLLLTQSVAVAVHFALVGAAQAS